MDKTKNMGKYGEVEKEKRGDINYERIIDINNVKKLTGRESAWKCVRNVKICRSWTMMDCVLQSIAHCLGD